MSTQHRPAFEKMIFEDECADGRTSRDATEPARCATLLWRVIESSSPQYIHKGDRETGRMCLSGKARVSRQHGVARGN